MIDFVSVMVFEGPAEAAAGFVPRRRAPAPLRYYDLGESSIVEWQGGVADRAAGAPRRFYSLRDLELRVGREPTLQPAVLIFHCSRCGSTLLARLLELDPANRVCIEPRALGRFLYANRGRLASPEIRHDLRVLLQSYGLEPTRGQKRLIFKLNSLSIHALTTLRTVLPSAELAYILRDPAEVVASLGRSTPAFLRAANRAVVAETLGVDSALATSDSAEQWWSRYIEWNLSLAYRHADDFTVAVDYRDLPARYLTVASRWSDRMLNADDPRVAETLAFHSKRPGVRFTPSTEAPGPMAAAMASRAYALWNERLRDVDRARQPGPRDGAIDE